jgi:hypothetical protein
MSTVAVCYSDISHYQQARLLKRQSQQTAHKHCGRGKSAEPLVRHVPAFCGQSSGMSAGRGRRTIRGSLAAGCGEIKYVTTSADPPRCGGVRVVCAQPNVRGRVCRPRLTGSRFTMGSRITVVYPNSSVHFIAI